MLLLNLPQNIGKLWARHLCKFMGAFPISHLEKPLKMSLLVHAYGQIFGFDWAHRQRQTLPLYHLDDVMAFLLLHQPPFGSIYTFRFPPSHLARLQAREWNEEVQQMCNVSVWLFFLMEHLSATVSWRHCCRSSSRWREWEVPWMCYCCCPGPCEYVALGRGHLPTGAHPHGLPCDKPGSGEWRPVRFKKKIKILHLCSYSWNYHHCLLIF